MGVHIPPHSIGIRVLDGETLRAAKARLVELEKATEWPPVPKTKVLAPVAEVETLVDVYEKWLAKAPDGSSRWYSRRAIKEAIIDPLVARDVVLLTDITTKHLDDIQESWKQSLVDGKGKRRPHGYAFNTINSYRRTSSCLFNYCVNVLELIRRNPWRGVPVIKERNPSVEQIMAGKKKDKGIATLPIDLKGQDNWLKIRAAAPKYAKNILPGQRFRRFRRNSNHGIWDHPDTWPTLLWLMYETGLRRGDVLIFRPDRIRDTKHGGSYTTTQRKTGDEVTCFLPQPLVDQLRALPLLRWRGRHDLYEQFTGKTWTPGAVLYPFYDGTMKTQACYMAAKINQPLAELGRLIGVPGLRPHRFRDSFAVNMLTLGLSLEDVQRMLGHKDIGTTQRYYAPYVLGIQEAIEQRQAAARATALLHFAEAREASPSKQLSVN